MKIERFRIKDVKLILVIIHKDWAQGFCYMYGAYETNRMMPNSSNA